MENFRPRNTKVCIQCHTRKIKCDLQELTEGDCRNCRRTNKTCRPRIGRRQRASSYHANRPTSNEGRNPECSPSSVGYMGDESYLPNPKVPAFVDDAAAEAAEVTDKILQASGATVLPSKMLVSALADVYFENIYPHHPIVDRADIIHHSSPLLLQSLCMIGSSVGHRRASVSQIKAANPFYLKVKTLLDVEFEKDNVVVLKALCLLTCRSVRLPTHISLQSNWHWQGVAVRYALHMGLHKEATYAGRESAGSCRRMWWLLFNHDKLSSFCYGRPSAIHVHETDVQIPSQADFPTPLPDNDIFIERTKLCIILGRLGDARYRHTTTTELESIGQALNDWLEVLPEGLRLGDESDQKPYRRVLSELHIIYFSCMIIYLQSLAKSEPNLGCSRKTLEECVRASSRIVRLFEEVNLRNDTLFLAPINNWFCLLAGVIQIRARATFAEKRLLRREEIQIIKNTLKEMTATVPSSNLILANLEHQERSAREAAERGGDGPENQAAPEDILGRPNNDDRTFASQSPSIPSNAPIMNFQIQDDGDRLNTLGFTPIDNWAFDYSFDFDLGDPQLDRFTRDAWSQQ